MPGYRLAPKKTWALKLEKREERLGSKLGALSPSLRVILILLLFCFNKIWLWNRNRSINRDCCLVNEVNCFCNWRIWNRRICYAINCTCLYSNMQSGRDNIGSIGAPFRWAILYRIPALDAMALSQIMKEDIVLAPLLIGAYQGSSINPTGAL